MTIFKCDEFCSGRQRHSVKRFPSAFPMQHPAAYAVLGPSPVASHPQYTSYPLPAAYTSGTYNGVSTNAMHTMETRSGLAGVPRDSMPYTLATYQTTYSPEPVTDTISHSEECGELPNLYYPLPSAGAVRAEPKFLQTLKVPEAGTQANAKLEAEALRPRSFTTAVAPSRPQSPSSAAYQRKLEQEIRRLHTVLNSRESQLEEKEQELQEAISELQKLRKQRSSTSQTSKNGPDSTAEQNEESELNTMRKRVELLRHERKELMELLLQKEKQVAVLDAVDPTAKETSALQLGVQAISMVQGTSEVREKLQLAEAEIKTLRAERVAAAELQQDTFDKLTDKRREAAELIELISQRDMKVARVEAYLQQKTRELEFFAERSKERLEKEKRKREEAEQEFLVAKEQLNAFRASLANRDEKIVQLQAEVVRRDTLLSQLEERVRVLGDDLNGAHGQLQQMLKGMAAKEAYMQELEVQLRKNDTERQAAYLTEVSKSRKLALDTRMQQDDCRAALNDKQEKLAAARHDLVRNKKAMEKIRKAIGSATEEADACYARSQALQSDGNHSHTRVPLHVPSMPVTDIPPTPLRESLESLGADFLVRQPLPSSLPTGANLSASASRQPASISRPPPSATSTTSYGCLQKEYYRPYSAVPGDALDQAIQRLFEKPEYRPLAVHVCRLEPGAYLCCKNKVAMELKRDGAVVIKLPGGKNMALASYLDLCAKGQAPTLS